MNILMTICARGGSKGIPSKNIKLLNNKPLIAHTIEQALKWDRAENIIVSTDSEEIAECARKYGVEVPFIRPKRLADDKSGKVPVIRHTLLKTEKLLAKKFDTVIDLDVTNPLRQRKDIDEALDTFIKMKADVLFSVVPCSKNPYFNMAEKRPDGFVKICKKIPKHSHPAARQAAPEVYSINTNIYIYDANFLRKGKSNSVFTRKTAVYIMDEITRTDIDTITDFEYTEFLIKKNAYPFD